MKMKTVDAQICLQCGSMEWVIASSRYQASYRVRPDGHVEFEEEMEDMEYYCSNCGSSALLGIEGTPRLFRELVGLAPKERVLRVLELRDEEKIRMKDDFTPEEVLEFMEDGFASNIEDKGTLEEFHSKAKGIIARWKLIEG